jgi:hypothetical protein
MRGTDSERTFANTVATFAPNPRAVSREVLNVSSILPIPGISKEGNASNLSLEGCIELADRVVHDGCALRIAAGNNHAAALSLPECRYAFGYRCRIRASWADVGE